MALSEASRAAIREAARRELERNPPPPASPELIAKLAAIFSGVQAPDMATAGLSDPAATTAEPHPAPDGKKSDAHDISAA